METLVKKYKDDGIYKRERPIRNWERAWKGKQIGRKGLAPIERRQIIEAHADNPDLSIRQLAKLTKQTPSSVRKTLSLVRKGKLDKEGYLHD